MDRILPYSLVNNRGDSDCFYQELSVFTDEVLNNTDPFVNKCIEDFCFFLNTNKIELLRSKNEYLVELLMIGVYWNNYAGNASRTGNLSKRILKSAYKQRKRYPAYKSQIDKARGYLSYLLLEKNNYTIYSRFSVDNLISLVNWLVATGEFNEEILRLRNWIVFLKTQEAAFNERLLETLVLFADRFFQSAKQRFFQYFKHLDKFHRNSLPAYKYREDYFFVSRHENEYYLNMFAAEVLNRGLHNNFIETKNKVLLLPTCMHIEPTTGCKARSDGKELVCAACSGECNIGKVSSEMKKQGIASYLIPHSSDFSKFLVKWKDCPDTSLIGVACVLNLLAGGYEMKRLNISSQCVFLDYCGCKKHWDKEGFATSLNVSQLKRVVQEPKMLSKKHDMVLA